MDGVPTDVMCAAPVGQAGSQPASGAAAGLARSYELLHMAGALIRFGGWSIDLAEGRVLWSDEVAAIHEMPAGYSPTLQDGISFYAPESRPRIAEVFAACARDGIPYDEELQLITSTGRRIWVRAVGTAIRDASGAVVRVQGAFQDIDEHKQAQVRLAESEERYRALFENMSAGFVVFEVVQDDAGRPADLIVLAANRGFEATTGLKSADAVGRRLTELLPGIEQDSADWIGKYGDVALTGRNLQVEQHSELLGVYYLVSAYRSGAKRCAVTFVDITERKRAEEAVREMHRALQREAENLELRVAERTAELEAAKVQAEAADRAKSSFLATVSHELRTPLNSVIGFTDVLLSGMPGPLNEEQARQLRVVRDSGGQLLSLIGDVLDFARIEAGQLRLEREELDLREVVARVGAAIGPAARRLGLSFELSMPADPARVAGDRRRIEQVLNNLLSNALKFTPAGSIELLLERHDGHWAVVVKDSGVGIRREEMNQLFQRFSQTDGGLRTSREGTGLGLAISKHLVEAMGGRIWVDSEWQVGSRFGFSLPALAGDPGIPPISG